MLQEHCTPERARKPGPGHSPINGKDSPAPFHKTASGAAVIRYGLYRAGIVRMVTVRCDKRAGRLPEGVPAAGTVAVSH